MKKFLFAAAGLSLVIGGLPALGNAAETSINVSTSEHLQTELYARGVQIYRCAAADAEAKTGSWVFQAPEADLFSDKGLKHLVGKHFDGPHWQGVDGSQVAGALSASHPAKAANSIPWLLLTGTSDPQPGLFAHISSIQRVDTRGGVTGPTVCDPATFGATLKVPYTATYRFYSK